MPIWFASAGPFIDNSNGKASIGVSGAPLVATAPVSKLTDIATLNFVAKAAGASYLKFDVDHTHICSRTGTYIATRMIDCAIVVS
jgi:hypothetical protein